MQLIKEYVKWHRPKWFIADDLITEAMSQGFFEPGDVRWWGQALQEAADMGVIRANPGPGWNPKRRHRTTLWISGDLADA